MVLVVPDTLVCAVKAVTAESLTKKHILGNDVSVLYYFATYENVVAHAILAGYVVLEIRYFLTSFTVSCVRTSVLRLKRQVRDMIRRANDIFALS